MAKPEKVAMVEEIRGQLESSRAVFVTDYRGLSVAQMTRLRRRLRELDSEYKVVKNTLTRIAAGDNADMLAPYLEGPTAVAFVKGDPVAVAKALNEFAREFRTLDIRGGILEGKPVGQDDVKALADLPSREVLLAQVLGGFQAPIAGLVFVLQGTLRKLVYALDAVRAMKEEGAGA
ncbi:MAG: 50S ribosomal protein L10 [Firmicutes bacterium]|nr:50S ribosomal protein L10 [Bacillota bacterium]